LISIKKNRTAIHFESRFLLRDEHIAFDSHRKLGYNFCTLIRFAIRAFALALFFIAIQTLVTPDPVSARLNPPSPIASLEPNLALPSGKLILSAASGGAWNIYAADPNGNSLARVAPTLTTAREPALSPDGKTLAFRSKRDGIWEIYTAPATGGSLTKLMRGMNYSGAPTWSPDGRRIAFEAMTGGNLNIWTINSDGTQALDLTEGSKAHDYAPAWSPDGNWVAFTSWRTGAQQIFITDATCGVNNCKKTFNLSQNKYDDSEPAFSPDGKKMAFVSDRDGQRAIYVAEFSITGLRNARRITFSGWDDQPAWSPDGNFIAFISPRQTRTPVYIVPAEGGLPRVLENSPEFAASVTWAVDASVIANDAPAAPAPLYNSQPDIAPADSGHPYDMRRLRSPRLESGFSRLSGRVADSFIALQARVKQETGYDFLGVVADMWRPLDQKCDVSCDNLSWHKAGRAVDTRLDSNAGLEIVREDMLGETFWRVYLRAASQDGTMGEPLKDAPWDLSYRARWVVGKGDGGAHKPVPSGFYVDFTELARAYGWQRISSHDEEEFDWKSNKLATEYWHFQKTDGTTWYQAMTEVFSDAELKSLTDWNVRERAGADTYLLSIKGIPAPAKAWRWFVLGP